MDCNVTTRPVMKNRLIFLVFILMTFVFARVITGESSGGDTARPVPDAGARAENALDAKAAFSLLLNDDAVFQLDAAARAEHLLRLVEPGTEPLVAAAAALELRGLLHDITLPAGFLDKLRAAFDARVKALGASETPVLDVERLAAERELGLTLASAHRRAGDFDTAASILDNMGFCRQGCEFYSSAILQLRELMRAKAGILAVPKSLIPLRAARDRPWLPEADVNGVASVPNRVFAGFTALPGKFFLEIGVPDSDVVVEIFIDGVLVARADKLFDVDIPPYLVIEPPWDVMPAGPTHLVLLRTASSSRLPHHLSLRVLDENGQPMEGVNFRPPEEIIDSVRKMDWHVKNIGEGGGLARYSNWRVETRKPSRKADSLTAFRLAAGERVFGESDRAAEFFFSEQMPGNCSERVILRERVRLAKCLPYLRARGRWERAFLADGLRKNDAAAAMPWYWKTLAEASTTAADRRRAAEKCLDSLSAENKVPGVLALYNACIVSARETKYSEPWEAKARVLLKEALQKLPDDLRLLRELVASKLFPPVERLDAAVRLLRLDPSDINAALYVAKAYRDSGRWDEALKAAGNLEARLPDSAYPRELKVECSAAKYGRNPTAEDAKKVATGFEDLLEMSPPDAVTPYRRYALWLRRRGDRRGAVRIYRELLEKNPAAFGSRASLEMLEGRRPFYEQYDYDDSAVRGMIREATKIDPQGYDSVRALDMTVARIFTDGSREFLDHTVRLALSRDGVDEISEVVTGGAEILALRTLLPDGSSRLPSPLPGYARVPMPGLTPGAAVESRLMEYRGGSLEDGIRFGPWYFSSPDFSDKFFLSELVLVLPRHVAERVNVLERNFSENTEAWNYVQTRRWDKQGEVIYRWTARSRFAPPEENRMPDSADILPNVCLVPRDEDIAGSFRDYLASRVHISYAIRREAGELSNGEAGAREKAVTLYRFVQSTVKSFRAGSTAHGTLITGTGNRTLLLAALLRAAGLSPRYLRVPLDPATTPVPIPSDVRALRKKDYSEEVLAVPLEGGELLYLDTHNRYLAPGMLGFRQASAIFRDWSAARIDGMEAVGVGLGSGAETFRYRLPLSAGRKRCQREWRVVADIQPDGGCSITGRLSCSAALGAAIKQRLSDMTGDERLRWFETLLNDSFPGADLVRFKPEGLEKLEPDLSVSFTASDAGILLYDQLGRAAIPTGIAPVDWEKRFAPETGRQFPVRVFEGWDWDEEVRFRLPEGLTPSALPAPTTAENDLLKYSLVYSLEAGGRVIVARRRVKLDPGMVAPENYLFFRQVMRRLDAAEARQIILVKKQD